MQPRRFPIGIQDFPTIRTENFHYVDKTDLVYQLTHDYDYVFLSRPRRFGKSLLVSTLQCYFEGRKELFEGLRMMEMEGEWEEYPVIRLDLSRGEDYAPEKMTDVFNDVLSEYEELYNIHPTDLNVHSVRLLTIIKTARATTGKAVVVLIDGYDTPQLKTMHKPELQEKVLMCVRDLFAPLKSLGSILRFVFLTGVTKFSPLNIYSGLNNLQYINMQDTYATICGITEQEVLDNFRPDIERMGEANGLYFDDALEQLKRKYGGYHFTRDCPDIYNPFSLVNALHSGDYNDYWFSTDAPTFLLEMLQERNITVAELEHYYASLDLFDRPTERMTSPIPVLYQSGYLTIKEYDEGIYILGIPNEEVRVGLSSQASPTT